MELLNKAYNNGVGIYMPSFNISCGYFDEHTKDEKIILEEAKSYKIVEKLFKIQKFLVIKYKGRVIEEKK